MTTALAVAPRALWYLTRGTGAVSLLLLTATVVLGVAHSVRWSPSRTPRFVVADIHRNVSLMVLVFIAIHIATAVVDGFAPIRWLDAVVPFASAYRPVWLGLGAVAFDVLIAIAVTSLLRARLGFRIWRAIHWTAYGSWGVAVFHGLGVGSDSRQTWMLALVAVSVAAVIAAIGWRVALGWASWNPGRLALAASAAVMPVALAGWMITGPLRAGWAQTSGTPSNLLSRSGGAGSQATGNSGTDQVVTLVLPSRARFDGQAVVSGQAGGQVTITVTGLTTDSSALSLNIDVHGTAQGEGRMSVTSGSVVLTPPDGAAAYRGSLTGMSEGSLLARLSDGHGDQIGVTVAITISPSGSVSGQVAIQPLSTGAGNAGSGATGFGSANGGSIGGESSGSEGGD